ncbi:hypothetical protein B4U79_17014, partial [Dinothrombium tinctorium]
RECWWTNGCQPRTWEERGCFPANLYEIVETWSCGEAGDMYFCCRKESSHQSEITGNSLDETSYAGNFNKGSNLPKIAGNSFSGAGNFDERGECSYYGEPGEIPLNYVLPSYEKFDPNAMASAHKTLPFGTCVKVTNLNSGKEVVVRINDRGPGGEKRILDLTKAAFKKVEDTKKGIFPCAMVIVGDNRC